MKKSLGYGIIVIGLIPIALSFPKIRELIQLTLPIQISDFYLTVAGVIIIIVGAFLLRGKSRGKQMSEVPIYHEDKVVGFRRMGKK